ncbi:MAG: Stk1 family PASTA domain-containing Ser/Thr kinase [Solobacterium sp.]|nr:Stk1 family PASTA domain-containing Ser/Thr kinase [Solobacterium sp.]
MSNNLIANRYEVFQHIGQGGMADVFLAVDTILNRQVAVKILRSELCTDAVSVLRFEREAQAATALSHPNIVEIYDVGDYKGHHYIVMEYVSGKSLKQVIQQRGALLTEEAIDIMKQLTGATAEAHRRGIIHRDIKPQNVIVKSDGSIKMLDFGIALAKGSMQLTQANNVMGSVHYLAPELAKGESASPQSDIYALGIVLYEMLTGDVPFKAEQAVQVALMQMHNEMPDVRSINPDIPQSVANIVIRATAKNPDQRYSSCNEMLEALRVCLRPEKRNEKKLNLTDSAAFVRAASTESIRQKEQTRMQNVDPDLARTGIRNTVAPKKHVAPLERTGSGRFVKPARIAQKETPVKEERKSSVRSAVQRKQKVQPLFVILVILLGLLVISGVYFALNASGILNPTANTIVVPDLVGHTLTEARAICTDNSLVLDTSTVEYMLTENIEKGQIISVTPSAGEEVEKGTRISVAVSSGIGVTVEDYRNRNINDVIRELSQYTYLKVTTREESSFAIKAGDVIRQELLEPGMMFNPNTVSEIVLVYSGYPEVTIPEDIDGMSVEEASAILESMGVEVFSSTLDTTGLSEEEIANLHTGVVIRSDPVAGSVYTQKEDNYVVLYYY